MITPNIRYYARMERVATTIKTPKYVVKAEAGIYPPMEELKGRNGEITMYLMNKLKEGTNVPAMRLQAKDALNFTGLKDFFVDGKLSGFAYGNPPEGKTYSKKELENPFYTYNDDGFLFIIHQDGQDDITPAAIELIVLEGAKLFIASFCKQLMLGGFDEDLDLMRKQAMSL